MCSGIFIMNLWPISFYATVVSIMLTIMMLYWSANHVSEYILVGLSINEYHLPYKPAHNFLCYLVGFSNCMSFYPNMISYLGWCCTTWLSSRSTDTAIVRSIYMIWFFVYFLRVPCLVSSTSLLCNYLPLSKSPF